MNISHEMKKARFRKASRVHWSINVCASKVFYCFSEPSVTSETIDRNVEEYLNGVETPQKGESWTDETTTILIDESELKKQAIFCFCFSPRFDYEMTKIAVLRL